MSKSFKITETPESLYINLRPEMKPIVKIIGFMAGLYFLGAFLWNMYWIFWTAIEYPEAFTYVEMWPSLAIVVLCLLAGLAIMRYATRKDYILIDQEKLRITKKQILVPIVREIPLKEIKKIKLTDAPEFTNHPLKSKNIDATGISTGEKAVQYMSDFGKIEICTTGKTFYVGPKIADWDAEEIVKKMNSFMKRQYV